MEIRVNGTVRVILDELAISQALKERMGKHTPFDCVKLAALDQIKHLGRSITCVSHRIELPSRAVINFKVVM